MPLSFRKLQGLCLEVKVKVSCLSLLGGRKKLQRTNVSEPDHKVEQQMKALRTLGTAFDPLLAYCLMERGSTWPRALQTVQVKRVQTGGQQRASCACVHVSVPGRG